MEEKPSVEQLRQEIQGLQNRVATLEQENQLIRAQEERRSREEELLHALIDNIPDTIHFKDLNGRFIKVNKAWALKWNLDNPDDAIGRTDFDLLPEELAKRSHDYEDEIIRQKRPVLGIIEKVIGTERSRWFSASKIPVIDKRGSVVGTCGITREITEAKESDEALEQERNLLRTLIDNMPDYIFIKDAESRFVINNKAHIHLLGAQEQRDLIGRTDMDIFPGQLAARYFSDEQVVLQTGKSIINREEPTKDMECNEMWLSTTKVALRDAEGKIAGLVGISRDITERKRYQEALQRAKDELELRVEERTMDLKDANERLEARLNQLRYLNTTSYELAQFIRLNELAPAILDSLISRFPEATASLCIRKKNRFVFYTGAGALSSEIGSDLSEKALDVFLKNELQRPFVLENWKSDEYVSQFAWPNVDDLPCYLAIPLLADNKALGIVQIFTSQDFLDIYDREKPVMTTLAAHAATTLSNAIHYQELGERARVQGELDAARSIQQRFTPQEKPDIPHVEITSVYHPAYEVGGDYLDYWPNDAGHWVVVIADVCGKGIPAALFMTMLRSVFRVEAKYATSARQLLCSVNESMKVNLDDKSFVTALCLIINKDGTSMSYARAGHPMMVNIGNNGNRPQNIKSAGLALGLVSESEMFNSMIDEITIPLQKNDRYLIYTDGLTEATDQQKNSYGQQRLFELLAADNNSRTDGIIKLIMGDVKRFTGTAPYHDDLTILALEIKG
ncbi:MAG: SpoIIE family protein phosphatase [Chitinivibrionales bacterium]|nr:SpoIIE family protein phosphatase [Chitinivibrionales bacterium]